VAYGGGTWKWTDDVTDPEQLRRGRKPYKTSVSFLFLLEAKSANTDAVRNNAEAKLQLTCLNLSLFFRRTCVHVYVERAPIKAMHPQSAHSFDTRLLATGILVLHATPIHECLLHCQV
jgi:hypothetical protein